MNLEIATSREMENALEQSMSYINKEKLDRALMIHNAGSLGSLDYLIDIHDNPLTHNYFLLNIA